MSAPVITIDGPAASGKGAVARDLSRRLGFHYLDSGKMYRAVALLARRRRVDLSAHSAVALIADELAAAPALFAQLSDDEAIGDEDTAAAASLAAAIAPVRRALLAWQRAMRTAPGLVAEGRDMGGVVFPDARLKVFLTAELTERARRRWLQLPGGEARVTMDIVHDELKARDDRDRLREQSPLMPAKGGWVVDSTNLSVRQVVESLLAAFQREQHTHRNTVLNG